ncbi:MAG: hypothetical protein QF578_23610 [Alphaproteobacteria bacterium]|jgi:serine/threonine protein phosphatase 1|nr:hypothetical protein [Alphaproteobacteria bacterium]MDP6813357.1 hypothetical protein [Alphaproteobacteria bacterium]
MLVTLNAPRRIWAVPAILGQAPALRDLHAGLADRLQPQDALVYLGNYMGQGPAVVETIDEVLAFQAALTSRPALRGLQIVHLRGAQEEMWVKLLEIQWAMQPAETFDWMLAHGAEATLRAYGGDPADAPARFRSGVVTTTRWTTELRETFQDHPGHYEFLHRLASAAPTSDGRLLFVSTGIDPARPLEKQNDAFWWGSPAFEALAEPFGGFALVIRGFAADRQGGAIGDHALSIDSGCGDGGSLRAVCFSPDGAILEEHAAVDDV